MRSSIVGNKDGMSDVTVRLTIGCVEQKLVKLFSPSKDMGDATIKELVSPNVFFSTTVRVPD
jgi:hypothetical protein